jgi:hypothetical protein
MLGADANGKPLFSEQRAFLDEHHVTDDEERRLWTALWLVITAAAASERIKRLENVKSEKPGEK